MRALVGEGGGIVIGVDLQKPVDVLDLAYNDPQGYTAAFNLNLLARLNRELDADFDLSAFAHRAFYNAERARIEMHLASLRAQRVRVAGRVFSFDAGETIHTENSYKYTPDGFVSMARAAGFSAAACGPIRRAGSGCSSCTTDALPRRWSVCGIAPTAALRRAS